MQNGEELEVTVRTSTRELSIYIIFLSILVIGKKLSLLLLLEVFLTFVVSFNLIS